MRLLSIARTHAANVAFDTGCRASSRRSSEPVPCRPEESTCEHKVCSSSWKNRFWPRKMRSNNSGSMTQRDEPANDPAKRPLASRVASASSSCSKRAQPASTKSLSTVNACSRVRRVRLQMSICDRPYGKSISICAASSTDRAYSEFVCKVFLSASAQTSPLPASVAGRRVGLCSVLQSRSSRRGLTAHLARVACTTWALAATRPLSFHSGAAGMSPPVVPWLSSRPR